MLVAGEAKFRGVVEAWMADDPEAGDREELRALLDRAFAGTDAGVVATGGAGSEVAADAEAVAELRDRFSARLRFGTAGLRGAVGAGPNRMNRAVVRAATAAVAGWLLGDKADAAGQAGDTAGVGVGVVVGCDARHRSADFAGEVAGVLAGAGITVHVLPRPSPTPLLAFAVRQLGAAAGVMITASHNPAADNGYKLYLSDGAQVIPPADTEIEQRIAGLGPLAQVPVAEAESSLIMRHGDEVAEAYLNAVAGPAAARPGTGPALTVVYTPMHGVAGELMLRAIRQAGFAAPHVVAAQAEPDPDFPTVAFPNPEEPGALDLALADARGRAAELVMASDPDGDRLAIAVPQPGGDWRVLTGDQVGALLGASLLERTAAEAGARERLVASTVVSSTLLAKIAAAAGARYAETLTGFKWIARAADDQPGTRFVFGYEEALGYAVGDVVRDKDGIGAALAMLWLATSAKAAGRSLLEVYDELETAHGVHLTSQLTLRTAEPARVMDRLRADPPEDFGDEKVSSMVDLMEGYLASAETDGVGGVGNAGGAGWVDGTGGAGPGLPLADVLIFRLASGRVVLRPSGTEPKTKCYIEITEPLAGRSLAAAREVASRRLAPVRSALQTVLADG